MEANTEPHTEPHDSSRDSSHDNSHETTQENQEDEVNQINQINLPPFEIIENDFFGIQLTPGVYELADINNAIKQKINESDYDFEFNIIPDTISMKSVLTTSNPIHFNSRLNTL